MQFRKGTSMFRDNQQIPSYVNSQSIYRLLWHNLLTMFISRIALEAFLGKINKGTNKIKHIFIMLAVT
jgi:hypothetical protein